MKRIAAGVTCAVLVAVVSVGGAFGASATKPWQAVVGHYKTTGDASKQITKLDAKKFSGFTTETEKRGQYSHGKKYEVEKSFSTQKEAKAEVAKLHKAGFKGASVESEKSEKKAG